jgi:hypothetical protein
MAGCGKLDNAARVVTGGKLACGTKLTFGTGKEPKQTVIHLCAQCAKGEPK